MAFSDRASSQGLLRCEQLDIESTNQGRLASCTQDVSFEKGIYIFFRSLRTIRENLKNDLWLGKKDSWCVYQQVPNPSLR
jgi:hypothetical protein